MRPINPSTRSLAVTPGAGTPANRTSMVLGRMTTRHWVASTCSTSLVPMPKASAPNAPCVDVCESPHTMTIPGCVRPSSGPMTCTMPWRGDAPGVPRAAAPRTPGVRSPRGPGAGPRTRAPVRRGAAGRRGRPRLCRTAFEASCSKGFGIRGSGLGTRHSGVFTESRVPNPESRLPLLRPRHHGTQRRAHALDQMVVLLAAHALEVGTALPTFLDPFTGEGAALDIGQDLLHPGADGGRDEGRAAGVIAVFRGVRDRVAHELHATAVHQVHDQLELVQALEIGELGRVAGGHERLEAGRDERRDSPAQHHLLTEQVALGLLAERGG